MTTLGLFLLYFAHLFSTWSMEAGAHEASDFETCIVPDLEQIESLRKELFKELPHEEGDRPSFGLLSEDWDRLYELEMKLPKDSIMKTRLVSAFRLLIAALYQAHLKHGVPVRPNNTSLLSESGPNSYNPKGNYNTDEVKNVSEPNANGPTTKDPTNDIDDVDNEDNEVAGSDNEETELPYPQKLPDSNSQYNSTPIQDIANFTTLFYEYSSGRTPTEIISSNVTAPLSATNDPQTNIDDTDNTNLNSVFLPTPFLDVFGPNLTYEEFPTKGFSGKDEANNRSTDSSTRYQSSFTTTETYNKSLEINPDFNITDYRSNEATTYSLGKNETITKENTDSTGSGGSTKYGSTTEYFTYSSRIKQELSVNETSTSKILIKPSYIGVDSTETYDNRPSSSTEIIKNNDELSFDSFSTTTVFSELDEKNTKPNEIVTYDVNQTTTHETNRSFSPSPKPEFGLELSLNENTSDKYSHNTTLSGVENTSNSTLYTLNNATGIKDRRKNERVFHSNEQFIDFQNVTGHSSTDRPLITETTQTSSVHPLTHYDRDANNNSFENGLSENIPIFDQDTDMVPQVNNPKYTTSDKVLQNNNSPSAISVEKSVKITESTISNAISEDISKVGSSYFRTTVSPEPSLSYYFESSLYKDNDDDYENNDLKPKGFPDGEEIDLQPIKGVSDYFINKTEHITTDPPNESFRTFTIVLKKLFESHNEDLVTNKLKIYQKDKYSDIRPQHGRLSNCRSNSQCVQVKNADNHKSAPFIRDINVQYYNYHPLIPVYRVGYMQEYPPPLPLSHQQNQENQQPGLNEDSQVENPCIRNSFSTDNAKSYSMPRRNSYIKNLDYDYDYLQHLTTKTILN